MKPSRSPTKSMLSLAIRLLNRIFEPLDQTLFARPIENPQDPIFIIGAPRSGTTLVYESLCSYLPVTYLPKILNNCYGIANLIFTLNRLQLQHYKPKFTSEKGNIPGALSPSESFNFWEDAIDAYTEGNSKKAIGLLRSRINAIQSHYNAPLLVKSLYLTYHLPLLLEAFPKARILYVSRDPLSTASSIIRIRKKLKKSDWWSVAPPGYQNHLHEPLEDQVAWQLSEIYALCNSELKDLGEDKCKRIYYEEFCMNPEKQLKAIKEWLNITKLSIPIELPHSFEASLVNPETKTSKKIQASFYYNRIIKNEHDAE